MVDDYNLEDILDEMRVVQAGSLVDFEELMEVVKRLAAIDEPKFFSNYRLDVLMTMFDDIKEVIEVAKNLVGNWDNCKSSEDIRAEWFQDNFREVGIAEVADDLCHWEEPQLREDYPKYLLPAFLYECTAEYGSKLSAFLFIETNEDGRDIVSIALQYGLRLFFSGDTAYVGSDTDADDWYDALYDAVYAPGKDHRVEETMAVTGKNGRVLGEIIMPKRAKEGD